MKREALVAAQPVLDIRGLVGADVVEHDMDLTGRVGPGDEAQEAKEVLGGVALAGLVRHSPGRDFKGREEAGRPVAPIVVGMALDLAGPAWAASAGFDRGPESGSSHRG